MTEKDRDNQSPRGFLPTSLFEPTSRQLAGERFAVREFAEMGRPMLLATIVRSRMPMAPETAEFITQYIEGRIKRPNHRPKAPEYEKKRDADILNWLNRAVRGFVDDIKRTLPEGQRNDREACEILAEKIREAKRNGESELFGCSLDLLPAKSGSLEHLLRKQVGTCSRT
jgi:hypothetical protein